MAGHKRNTTARDPRAREQRMADAARERKRAEKAAAWQQMAGKVKAMPQDMTRAEAEEFTYSLTLQRCAEILSVPWSDVPPEAFTIFGVALQQGVKLGGRGEQKPDDTAKRLQEIFEDLRAVSRPALPNGGGERD